MLKLSNSEFLLICKLAKEKAGINLTEAKKDLIIYKSKKLLDQYEFTSFKQYYDFLISEPSGHALLTFIDCLTTNHTFFFREEEHFDILTKDCLPWIINILKEGAQNDFRIWCAACSTGEEAYTIGMIVAEFLSKHSKVYDPAILASDISERVLKKAVEGIYSFEQTEKIPKHYKQVYLEQLDKNKEFWKVKDAVKNMIYFRTLNLIEDNFPFKKKFHAVFCRNVMIYFDEKTRGELLLNLYNSLEKDGFLFIGHSESLGRKSELFYYVKPSVYRKL